MSLCPNGHKNAQRNVYCATCGTLIRPAEDEAAVLVSDGVGDDAGSTSSLADLVATVSDDAYDEDHDVYGSDVHGGDAGDSPAAASAASAATTRSSVAFDDDDWDSEPAVTAPAASRSTVLFDDDEDDLAPAAAATGATLARSDESGAIPRDSSGSIPRDGSGGIARVDESGAIPRGDHSGAVARRPRSRPAWWKRRYLGFTPALWVLMVGLLVYGFATRA